MSSSSILRICSINVGSQQQFVIQPCVSVVDVFLESNNKMLSGPQSRHLLGTVAKTTSYSLDVDDSKQDCASPDASGPAIAVTRPSLVSALVDETDLSILRAKYYEESRNRSSSLCVGHSYQVSNQLSKSAQSSPKLQRKSSFKGKKRKALSNGVDGYEPLNSDFSDEAQQFSRERVTSVHRVLSRNNSFTATPSSPRPYRAKMNLVPAKHRVVQSDSSDDEDDDGLASPVSESNLDFGSGSRRSSSHVSSRVQEDCGWGMKCSAGGLWVGYEV